LSKFLVKEKEKGKKKKYVSAERRKVVDWSKNKYKIRKNGNCFVIDLCKCMIFFKLFSINSQNQENCRKKKDGK
jgi:hypothetical protein